VAPGTLPHRLPFHRQQRRPPLAFAVSHNKEKSMSNRLMALAIVAALSAVTSGAAMAQGYAYTCPGGYYYAGGVCNPGAAPGAIVGGAVGTAGAIAGGALNAAGNIVGAAAISPRPATTTADRGRLTASRASPARDGSA
jgi:hypothetical protein